MRNTSKIVFATVVIFAAGVVTGGLLVNHANRSRLQRGTKTAAAKSNWQPAPREVVQREQRELRPMLEQQRMEFILHVHKELQLTPEQRERIEKIVREGQERSKALWEKAAPEMRKNMQEVREQIRAELKPEQRKKFEQLQKQMQSRPTETASGSGVGSAPGRGNVDPRRSVQPRDGQRSDYNLVPPSGDQPEQPLPPASDKR